MGNPQQFINKEQGESREGSVEYFKAFVEYLKHLTTLSTGSILLIATFLEKIFTNPLWKPAVIISLVGFMISVLSSIVTYTVVMYFNFPESPHDNPPEWVEVLAGASIFFTWTGFLIGILSLAIFALKNLIG